MSRAGGKKEALTSKPRPKPLQVYSDEADDSDRPMEDLSPQHFIAEVRYFFSPLKLLVVHRLRS